jgi:hypothetical protein
MSTYSSKLRDPRWQKKRLEVLEASNWHCDCCDDSNAELQVHHMIYRKGVNPWEYNIGDLITLCATCHKEYTDLQQQAAESMLTYIQSFPSFQYGFFRIIGFMNAACEQPTMDNNSYNAGYLAGRVAELAQFNNAEIESKMNEYNAMKGDV